ncbi:MAG: DNA/RNA nuclease SfsA [Tissierellaceae bacterium]|nr:DNA/RNA nuclease SfsA [Tissierellaceae bacterium]
MIYNKIVEGIFLNRPNRFIAQVLVDNIEETVHVKNTGRCKELLIPGCKVILEDCSHNPNRKTKYSLIAVYKDDMLVNMDSQVPNGVVFEALKENKIHGLKNLDYMKREVTFGNSRFDIYFETEDKKGFIEVKGVTLEEDNIARFPDAPTERGTKHVLELIQAVEQGYIGIIFFLIQMKGPRDFRLNWKMDKSFSDAVKLASQSGVIVMAYDSIVNEDSIEIGEVINLNLNKP